MKTTSEGVDRNFITNVQAILERLTPFLAASVHPHVSKPDFFSEQARVATKRCQPNPIKLNCYEREKLALRAQDHYDFGMRAVKSVLVAAGQLKRKEPGSNEDLLLIRAMRDSNVPKFLEHDLPLFHGIVCDLFPGVVVPYVDYGVLQEAIEAVLVEEQLQKVPSFISKIIQVSAKLFTLSVSCAG